MNLRFALSVLMFSFAIAPVIRGSGETPPAPSVAPTAKISTPDTQLASVTIGSVLTALEPYGRGFQAADTTTRKGQVRDQARATAERLLDGRRTVLRSEISDVRVLKPGLVLMTFRSADLRPYDPNKKPSPLYVNSGGTLAVPLSESEALKLSKGMTLEMTGVARFVPKLETPAMNALSPTASSPVLRATLAGDTTLLGTICMDKVTWRAYVPTPVR